jgi:hypothetical protein
LKALIIGRTSRSETIGVFLALLELIREKRVLAHQGEVLGEIEIRIAPEEHRRQYAHASLHLADERPDEQADGDGASADESARDGRSSAAPPPPPDEGHAPTG